MEGSVSQLCYHENRNRFRRLGQWSKKTRKTTKAECKAFPLVDDFKIIKEIGKGGFATVVMAEPRNAYFATDVVAIKVIKKAVSVDEVITEVNCMEKIHHPNVMRLLAAFFDDCPCLVMELADGTLFDLNVLNHTRWNEYHLFTIMDGVLKGLRMIHDHQILHLDLKPSNILMFGNVPKISDFGAAIQLKVPLVTNGKPYNVKLKRVCTTLEYCNYEGCSLKNWTDDKGRMYKYATASVKTDLYSVGAIFFECLKGYNLIKPGDWAYRDFEVKLDPLFWDKAHLVGRQIEVFGAPSPYWHLQRNPLSTRLKCVAEPWYGVFQLMFNFVDDENQVLSVKELVQDAGYIWLRHDVQKLMDHPFTAVLPARDTKTHMKSQKFNMENPHIKHLNGITSFSISDTHRLAVECYYLNRESRKMLLKSQKELEKKEARATAAAISNRKKINSLKLEKQPTGKTPEIAIIKPTLKPPTNACAPVFKEVTTKNDSKTPDSLYERSFVNRDERSASISKQDLKTMIKDTCPDDIRLVESDIQYVLDLCESVVSIMRNYTNGIFDEKQDPKAAFLNPKNTDPGNVLKPVLPIATKIRESPNKSFVSVAQLNHQESPKKPVLPLNPMNSDLKVEDGNRKKNQKRSRSRDDDESAAGVKRGKYQPQEGYRRNKPVLLPDNHTIVYECVICGKTYQNSTHLSRHKQDEHLVDQNKNPYECDCDRIFKRKDSLWKHSCELKVGKSYSKIYLYRQNIIDEEKRKKKEAKIAEKLKNPVKRGRPRKIKQEAKIAAKIEPYKAIKNSN